MEYVDDMLEFEEVQFLLKNSESNFSFRQKTLPDDEGAVYDVSSKDKRAVIDVNQSWIKRNPKLLSVFLFHELCHHVQMKRQMNMPLNNVSQRIFLEMLQEAQARVQDLALLARLKLKNPAKYDINLEKSKTIPVDAYTNFLKTQVKGDFQKANAHFFILLLSGKDVGASWHKVYRGQALASAKDFKEPRQKGKTDFFSEICSDYAKRYGLTVEQINEIYLSQQSQDQEIKNKVFQSLRNSGR